MIVVDTSALVAIFFLEPEGPRFVTMIRSAARSLISAASLPETSIVLDGRIRGDASSELDRFIAEVGLEVEPVTLGQVNAARRAYRTWAEGNHPARLTSGIASPTPWPRRCSCLSCSRATTSPRRTSFPPERRPADRR